MIKAPRPLARKLSSRIDSLPMLFIVSQVEVTELDEEAEIQVEVGRAPGEKCSRCWNYRVSVGQDNDQPEICDRCLAVVSEAARG